MKFKLGPIQRKWIETLKEHPERQTIGKLGRIIGGQKKMCCLGQGGLIAGVCKWKKNELVLLDGTNGSGWLRRGFHKLGLRDEEGSSTEDIFAGMPSLSSLNDNDFDWPHIAVYEYVYRKTPFRRNRA